jgi:hypothetical protein
MDVTVINMQEGLWWGDCPICWKYRRLDHAVGWYEGPVQVDPGTILPSGDKVGGRSVCKKCHDEHYRSAP